MPWSASVCNKKEFVFSREVFGRELIRAAKTYIGKPAVFHWEFAGNCLDPNITGRCLESGMGPEIFDCSGFIVRSLCDVTGTDIAKWPAGMRHVRDMWQESGTPLNDVADLSVGDILVEEYRYKSQDMSRPGHIGIVVANGQEMQWLHASPKSERVLISEVPAGANLLGTVSVNT